MLMKTTD